MKFLVLVVLSVAVAGNAGVGRQQPGGQQTAQVDLMELNHFIDDEGREVFRQLVFYDWSSERSRFLVRGWRLVKSPAHLPRQTWKPRGVYATWEDNSARRRVEAKQFRETWTQKDPEKENRRWLAEEDRVSLWSSTPRPVAQRPRESATQ